ncbi:MAG: ABC transporter permease [Solirubrobacterales bacterium]
MGARYVNYLMAGIFVQAIVIGRTYAGCLRAVVTLIIMVVAGVIVRYRAEGTPLEHAAAGGILLLFSFAISWVGALMEILVPNVDALQKLSFIVILPLMLISSAFVEPSTMPSGLEAFAENQPVSQPADAVRSLTTALPADGSITASVLWSLGILSVAVPMVGWAYRRANSR